jgi:hypothetical protein
MISIAAKTVDLNDLERMKSFTLRECIEEVRIFISFHFGLKLTKKPE